MIANTSKKQLLIIFFLIFVLIASSGCFLFKKKDKKNTENMINQANIMLDDTEERANFNSEVIDQTAQTNLNAQNTSGISVNDAPRIIIKSPKNNGTAQWSQINRRITVTWVTHDRDGDDLLVWLEFAFFLQGKYSDWSLIMPQPIDSLFGEYSWDMLNYVNGKYKLKATVSDGNLNSSDVVEFRLTHNTQEENELAVA